MSAWISWRKLEIFLTRCHKKSRIWELLTR
uniref:Uncharacterized protein n=1 Tax=Rhizophora mucronata TaxID=61149 RepID=A0A2P2J220_RHIMU